MFQVSQVYSYELACLMVGFEINMLLELLDVNYYTNGFAFYTSWYTLDRKGWGNYGTLISFVDVVFGFLGGLIVTVFLAE